MKIIRTGPFFAIDSNKLATVVLERLVLSYDEQIALDSLGYQLRSIAWDISMRSNGSR